MTESIIPTGGTKEAERFWRAALAAVILLIAAISSFVTGLQIWH